MKIERKKINPSFEPVVITLENEEEIIFLKELLPKNLPNMACERFHLIGRFPAVMDFWTKLIKNLNDMLYGR